MAFVTWSPGLTIGSRHDVILRTFEPGDFEIRRLVGMHSFATITDWEYEDEKAAASMGFFAPTRTINASDPSLGLASIMVNTAEFRQASSLDVKLRDFSFASPASALAQGKDLERARRANAITPAQITAFHFAEDIYALGYAFTEFVFSVFSRKE